jgi:hypothetical protein
VTHEGVKYADAASTKPPTIIPPTARHEDTIIPVGDIKYSDGWRVESLLPVGTKGQDLIGQNISLFLPMEISGKIENYTFSIRIESVR